MQTMVEDDMSGLQSTQKFLLLHAYMTELCVRGHCTGCAYLIYSLSMVHLQRLQVVVPDAHVL
jgi:hypothetical protein